MKNQQLARKALQKARARQTSYSEHRRKEAENIIPGSTEVILKSLPYVKQLGRSHKTIGPWLGPFKTLEVPDNNDNFKLELPPVMSGIHPWIHRSHLRIYNKPDNIMYPGQRMAPPPAPVELDAQGEEQWEVEKILNDKIYWRKRMFLIKWKGFPDYEATWEPL